MHLPYNILNPTLALIAFLLSGPSTCASQGLSWPYNLPPHVKYFPEEEVLMKRNNDLLQRLQREQPLLVKKMGPDPGEMFFLDYWSFHESSDQHDSQWGNVSSLSTFGSPVLLHARAPPPAPQLLERRLRLPVPAARSLAKRDFVCPTGYSACTSIDRPNVCCPYSSTCQIVPDTGLGDAGCCDASQTCAGSLSQCPADYSSCPQGGGCCLPGFACYEEGCVQTSTTVVYISPSTTSTSSSTLPSTAVDTTTVIVTPPESSSPSTSSVPPTPASSSIAPSITTSSAYTSQQQNSLICFSGFRSCPSSLGGGCCPTDRACGRDYCPELTSTDSPSPPVRGTSSSVAASETASISYCPTGYYACSAYYPSGCCQIGRDCQTTSCPTISSVTVVGSGSVTVVAPTGTSVDGSLTGACARGWATCGTNVGGGCCPSGYDCGTAYCTASVSGLSATQGKVAPNSAALVNGKMASLRGLSIAVVLVGLFTAI